MPELITSAANPLVKRIRALADRKHRRRAGAFVVEGLQPVWRAVSSGWPIEVLVIAPDLLTADAPRQMVDDQQRRGVRVARVSRDLFARLSGRDGPAGLLAVVRGSVPDLGAWTAQDAGPVIALDRAGNPGNVGTILRSADAAGAAGMVLAGPSADPLSPAAVKASMGSVFAVPLARAAATDDLLAWSRDHHRPVLAITGHADRSLWDATLPGDAVLLLGSEGDGLPDEIANRCDAAIAIPMQGTAESLNLATAASLVLYELKRRRHAGDQR